MTETQYVPVKKKRRKRIVRKKSLYEVALTMLPDREPAGLNFYERKMMKEAGLAASAAYLKKYGKKPESEERTEFWLFGGVKNKKAVERTWKVNIYDASFLSELIEIIKNEAVRHKVRLK